MAQKAWWQEREVAFDTASTVRKQKEVHAGTQLSFSSFLTTANKQMNE